MKTVTPEQFQSEYGQVDFGLPTPESDTGFVSRVGSELGASFTGLQKTTERGAELFQEGKPVQGAVMSGLGAVGGIIRGALSPVTTIIAPIIESGLKASGIIDNQVVQEKIRSLDAWAKANPDAAENLKNVFEVGGVIVGGRAITSTLPTIKRGVAGAKEASGRAIQAGTEAITPIVKGTVDATKMVVGSAARIPGRVATNIAEKQAAETAIGQLPTKVAQQAARDGIDISDVKTIYQIPKETKKSARELTDTVMKFAKKETDINPIEIVGKPVVARMKVLESLKNDIGKRLGAVSEKLGKVTSEEVTGPVFGALQKVNGLSNLKVNANGVLNFKDTVLATSITKSDRAAIQRIFTEAIKGGTGKQKHLLRQELFEVLGGKKRAGVQLTDTQAKAFDAIRKGLSDVLETKNSSYKDLSGQYRKIIQPINDMRKAMQSIPGVTEDVLDMSAGLLARRLTSTSLSQGKVRTILDAMDNASKIKGNLRETTESLQNLYNVLGKYYDLAPSTGFQGQIKAGIESTRGLGDIVTGAVRSVAGETTAVRQKALENAIKEAFGN